MVGEDKAAFHWELMKLLAQVAWADDELAESEQRVVIGLAQRLGLPADQIAELTQLLASGRPLPPPDLALLRSRRQEVLEAAEQIVLADDEISDDENLLLAELTVLMGGSSDPEDVN